jgi:CRP-like cAMP-binding protein
LSNDDARTLRWIDGFRDLPSEDIRSISGKCRWKWYRPQQHVFSQNDETTDVFFIVQGSVRITNYSITGKQVSFRDLTVGESFGDLAAIDGYPRSATAVAISDAFLASMSTRVYWETMMSYPPVAAACLKRLANLVRTLSDRVIEYSLLPVSTRIKLELFRLARRHMRGPNTAEINPAPTHLEVASRVATHREAVTRELRRLARENIAVRDGRKLLINDVNALRSALRNSEDAV